MNVEKLKQKILDLAIRGKLVPQDPHDEPASVLIEKIKAEKERLAKEGKIKASKEESYIYKGSDNCYYEKDSKVEFNDYFNPKAEFAKNIIWIKGKDILFPMETKRPSGDVFRYIDIDAINNKNQTVETPKLLERSKAPSRASRKVYASSTLFSLVRPYLKNIAYVGNENSDCIVSTGFYVCTPMPFINDKYLYLLLTSDYIVDKLNFFMKGDNSPSIKTGDIEELYFPIPSLEYQNIVVDKLNNVFSIIENMRQDADALTKYVDILKQRILENLFGNNSSYKSYYENYSKLEEEISLISTHNKELKSREVEPIGDIPVVSQSKQLIDGYSDDKSKIINDVPVIIFGDHTRIVKYIDFDFIPGADGTKIIKSKRINIKYLYYFILYSSFKIEDRGYNRHFSLLKNILIPIPPDDVQFSIINHIESCFSILDTIN